MPVEPNSNIYGIATQKERSNVIVAASILGYVYVSEDGGDSRQKLQKEFGEVRSVALLSNQLTNFFPTILGLLPEEQSMPKLTKHQIGRISDVMMQAGGASAGHAGIVADHLANANLAGYDSHGFIRIPQYLKEIEKGLVDPKTEPEVVGNHGGILQIDGHSTFGQVVATRATELAIEKARDHGVSLVSMGNHTHTGRIGNYPEMAAAAGLAAIMFTGWTGKPWAPWFPLEDARVDWRRTL